MTTETPPYFADETVTLWHGDSLNVLRAMPDESVNCCVTSPPYFGLRDYGEPGQMGAEASQAEYVENMRVLFAEVRRVLAVDGSLWLNLGDSYYSGRGNPGPNSADEKQAARRGWKRPLDQPGQSWAKPKDMLGIPWRVAFALQEDGWTLRNAIVWHKPNAMPDSVTDRFGCDYELVFLLVRNRRYFFDLEAVKVPATATKPPGNTLESLAAYGKATGTERGSRRFGGNPSSTLLDQRDLVNPGSVWDLTTQPFAEAHFAVMPLALAERCIAAGCKPGGTGSRPVQRQRHHRPSSRPSWSEVRRHRPQPRVPRPLAEDPAVTERAHRRGGIVTRRTVPSAPASPSAPPIDGGASDA